MKTERKKREIISIALLECRKCRDITEHKAPHHDLAACNTCGTKRGQGSSAISGPEMFTLTNYRRIPSES